MHRNAKDDQRIHMNTKEYNGILGTKEYIETQGNTKECIGMQRTTKEYKAMQRETKGYT